MPYASRRATKRDANEKEIISSLRKLGCSVTPIDVVDIIVSWKGFNFLFEVKDPAKPPSARKLTEREQKFFDEWKGQVDKIESTEEAISIMLAFISLHSS